MRESSLQKNLRQRNASCLEYNISVNDGYIKTPQSLYMQDRNCGVFVRLAAHILQGGFLTYGRQARISPVRYQI